MKERMENRRKYTRRGLNASKWIRFHETFLSYLFFSLFCLFFLSKSWSLRWLWEFQVNANAMHRSKGYKSLINPFIAFNTKREKEAYVPVSSLIANTTYSAICSMKYLFSQFIRLAKWQFDSSFVPWTESVDSPIEQPSYPCFDPFIQYFFSLS